MVARVLCVLGLSSLVCLAACVGGCSGGGSGGGSSSTAPQAAIITSISPTSVQAGAGATTLQVTGSSFVSGSVVTFSGQNLSTTYSSATSLTAVIPAASLSAGETAEIAVVNPGAVASGNVAFAVDSPTPALTSVSPSSAVAGSSGTFTLTGTGFEPNSVVHLNGAALTTVFVSTTSLTVNLTAAQLLQAGTDQVTVVNPAPAGGISPFVYLQITQPVPVLQSISPSSVLAGSGPVMLTLTGTNFLPTATVTANGNALNVTGQSSTSITATLPASAVAQGAILSLLVTNPGPNSESSAPQNFAVIGIPSISLLSPGAAAIGGPDFTLTVSGSNFQPNSVVNWNGTALPTTYGGFGQLTATVPAADIAGFATDTLTVSTPYTNPTSGVLVSPGQNFSTLLSLANNDIAYNSRDGYLYLSVPSSMMGAFGNSIVAIDPLTGNFMRAIGVGSNPNHIAISDDGTQLFVGLDGAGAVQQVNLTSGRAGTQFSLGGGSNFLPPFTAAALAVLPGEPNSVAVLDTSGVVRIFDSGVARAQSSSGLLNTYFNSSSSSLTFGPSATTLYVNAPYGGVIAFTAGTAGVTAAQTLEPSGAAGGIQYDNGSLYLPNGTVLNAGGGALLGTFSASVGQAALGPVVSDSSLGLAFVAYNVPYVQPAVLVFNESSYLQTGSIPVSGALGPPPSFERIVRWGPNGLALSTATQIYVLQSSVVQDLSSSPADVAVTLSAPPSASIGVPLTWTAIVTNNGPNPALGVALTLSLPDSLIAEGLASSQGSCAAATCCIGVLGSGSTATVSVTAIPSVSGSLESTAIVASLSYDPVSSNNQVTSTTTVTGTGIYSGVPIIWGISPALVQSGSTAFTLTVTGRGFNSASTVQINGSPKPTTYVSGGQLTAIIDAASVADYGWVAVTVSNPTPGGGVSNTAPLTIYALVNVPANGISFDPFTRMIYATLPSSSAPLTGNSVVTIDPTSGTVGTPINVGSEPNLMAETSDGNYLYIGLIGAASLARFNLVTRQVEATIPMTLPVSLPITAYGLSTMPGSDTTLAVDISSSGQPAIFDVSGPTGTFRTNIPLGYSGSNPVFASPTEVYTFDNYTSANQFYRYAVNAQGLTEIDGSSLDGLGGSNFPFVLANGTVYGASGGIINPSTTPPSQIATLSTFGMGEGFAVAPDPATATAFLLLPSTYSSTVSLYRYDINRGVGEAQLLLPVPQGNAQDGYDMLRWGQDGLALRAYPEYGTTLPAQIMLLRGPFVLPSELNANSAPVLTAASQTSIPVNSGNLVLTLSGSAFLPGAVALWNGSPRSTTFISPSQLTVAIPASDVASAASDTLTVQNPGSAASGSVTISVQ